MSPKQRTRQQYELVETWNRNVPVGTKIAFQKDDGTRMVTKTRSRAQMLGEHTAVVWLDNITGCVSLERCSRK